MPFRALYLLCLGFALACARAGEPASPISPATAKELSPAEKQIAHVSGVYGLTRVHRMQLAIQRDEWNILLTSTSRGGGVGGAGGGESDFTDPSTGRIYHVGGGFGGYFPWVHADVRFNDILLKNVGLRHKGNSSFTIEPSILHRNLKIKTDLFGGKGTLEGDKTFNFAAGPVDPSRIRESFSYAVFRAAGVPAPRTAYVEAFLTVPGLHENVLLGTYTMIENVNKQFLKEVLPPGDGLLMKPERAGGYGLNYHGNDWTAYIASYRPQREATPYEQKRVIEFAQLIHQTDVAVFRRRIGEFVDIDNFLRFIAVNGLLVNMDSFLRGSHNFYLYLDPKDDKFRFIPWDMDRSLGSFASGGAGNNLPLMAPYTSSSPLTYWLLDDPAVNQRYREIIREITSTIFTKPELTKLLEALEDTLVRPLAAEFNAKRLRGNYGFGGGDGGARYFIENRLYYVGEQMAGRQPGF